MMNGEKIGWKHEVKYLGTMFDKKLLWNRQVDYTICKAKSALMVCRRITGKTWGCLPRFLHWMYTFIMRLVITNEIVAWFDRMGLVTARTLDKVQ